MELSKWLDADEQEQGREHTYLFSASLSWGKDVDLCFHVACLCVFERLHISLFIIPLGDPFGFCAFWKAKLYTNPLAISSGEKLEELHDWVLRMRNSEPSLCSIFSRPVLESP